MQRQLYFDISSEQKGGSLYRITDDTDDVYFLYQYSIYNDDTDEIKVSEERFATFPEFWSAILTDPEWFYQHPLFVHPEQRDFIREQLKNVNWGIHPNKKWQDSHQRQWKKVLSGSNDYYRS